MIQWLGCVHAMQPKSSSGRKPRCRTMHANWPTRADICNAISGHAFTHRIVMTDADQTAISYCEGMADAKQSWNFLCDRVVPQMQVHARTYEDPKRVAKGLFEGSYAYLSMQTDAPVTSVPSYAAKCWQVVCDVVPLAPPPGLPNASWIVPAAPGNASSLYWREVETSTFATLERSVLPLDSMGLLWDMWGRKPAAVRMRLRDKLGHVIASGSEDEVATVRLDHGEVEIEAATFCAHLLDCANNQRQSLN